MLFRTPRGDKLPEKTLMAIHKKNGNVENLTKAKSYRLERILIMGLLIPQLLLY